MNFRGQANGSKSDCCTNSRDTYTSIRNCDDHNVTDNFDLMLDIKCEIFWYLD